jgi:transposase
MCSASRRRWKRPTLGSSPWACIKLGSVISDIVGVSGRRMIEAMVAGVDNPHQLAALAERSIKASPQQLHDALDVTIQKIDREVDGRIECMDAQAKDEAAQEGEAKDADEPFRGVILRLCSIPGVSRLSAITILAEIGRDLSRFPTAGHLVSWAGLCPAQNESAGKRKSSRLRKGAPWLKTMLVQCAWAARRKKNSYYAAQFNRLKSRRGPQKAICAVAASILTAIYHMLINGTPHHDLGVDYFDRRSPETKARRLLAQLHRLGFAVKLQPLAEAA